MTARKSSWRRRAPGPPRTRAQNDHEALAFIADRGEAAALKYAESAQSPADRGKVIVRLWVDGLNGSLHQDPDYERALSGARDGRLEAARDRFVGDGSRRVPS
jgi:hypothetical protein